jgi:predicted nucleic acid-binding protein
MLIADTGPLVAMLNAKDRHHEACTALFRRFRGPIIVPAPIVTEVATSSRSNQVPQSRPRSSTRWRVAN